MDARAEARMRRRWGTRGAVLGAIVGAGLGIARLIDGEPVRVLLLAPAFAFLAAALSILARARTDFSYLDVSRAGPLREPLRERVRWIARNLGPALALMAVGMGLFVLSGLSRLSST